MSMSGAFDAMTSAVVTPRPARPSGVRASVRPKSVWVRLSIPLVIYLHDSTRFRGARVYGDRGAAAAGACVGLELGGAPLHHAARDRAAACRNQAVLRRAPRRDRLSLDRSGSVAGH